MPSTQAVLNLPAVEALMRALGVDSTAAMSRRTGIERSYLSRILRGERPAQPSQVIAIADALLVPQVAILTLVETTASAA